MIRLAKKMARAALGIGIAIGILMAGPLTPLATARPAPAPMAPDGGCADFGDQDQATTDFINLQCSVHQALFGDGSAPGSVYRFDKDVPQPGSYPAKSWDGRDIKFVAVTVIDLDFKTNAPDLYAQGITGRYVIGTLYGPASSAAITGVLIQPNGHMGCTSAFILQVQSQLSQTDYDTYAQNARIQAGVRVLDVNTYKSYSLDSVTSWDSASMSSSDPATVYATNVNGQMSPEEQVHCVQVKMAGFQIDANAAELALKLCVAGAVALFELAMIGCAVAGFDTGPFAPVVVTACCLLALAVEAASIALCYGGYAILMNQARQHLNLELRECGIMLLEV